LITESDPLRLKGLLGACRGSIGSRYHGLVSCLSQGVPAFGTSWSHKYQALYADYDLKSGLIESLSTDVADELSRHLADDHWMMTTRQRLLNAAEKQKRISETMWREVFGAMDKAMQRRAAR
jgi:colanic acid/amylovoran biosynthesis protein